MDKEIIELLIIDLEKLSAKLNDIRQAILHIKEAQNDTTKTITD